MQIKSIMSKPVVTCPENSTLDNAARLMWEFDCGIVPVVGEEGRLAGVVTDRDICMAAYTQGKPLSSIPVTTAMCGQVIAAHADDTVESVESLMRASQIRRIPVLDGNGHVAGIVSVNDLSRLAARAHRHGVDRELVNTMAAICQPRSHEPLAKPELVSRPSLAG